MALPGAYAQYKNNKVLTASPAELTLMLYEGAIKFCNIAMMAMLAPKGRPLLRDRFFLAITQSPVHV